MLLLLVLIVVFSLESLNDVRAAINGVSDTHISIFNSTGSASVSAKAAMTLEQRTAARAAALGRCVKSGSQVATTNG